MVTAPTGAREIRVPLKPEAPAGSCAWSIVANYPACHRIAFCVQRRHIRLCCRRVDHWTFTPQMPLTATTSAGHLDPVGKPANRCR